ncbi:MAG: Holliday junction branch migration protein RuvA [Chloroflexota bacterium]|nr:Holliday junction branch migration protein RuvA [Chloroflexota bacterium]
MIASIQGHISAVGADYVIIVVGGLGLKVFTTPAAISQQGSDVLLHTALIVREDALTLYGFPTLSERELFDLITTVSGIGPRLGLAILSHMSMERLRQAVLNKQPELLTRVPGIGKKLAEKIVFELRDKLRGAAGVAAIADTANDVDADVLEALITFGYSQSEASAAIKAINTDVAHDFEERMRAALAYFAQ